MGQGGRGQWVACVTQWRSWYLEAGAVLLHDGRQLYLSRPDFLHAHGFIKTIAFALRRVGREARASRHKAVKDHMHHAQGTVVAFEFKQAQLKHACRCQVLGGPKVLRVIVLLLFLTELRLRYLRHIYPQPLC